MIPGYMADIKSLHEMKFKEAVYALVARIPPGKVLGYGHVAALIGRPRNARQVGFALSNLEHGTKVPWWRVIRSDGSVALQGDIHRGPIQIQNLRSENIAFNGSRINMKIYRWTPDVESW